MAGRDLSRYRIMASYVLTPSRLRVCFTLPLRYITLLRNLIFDLHLWCFQQVIALLYCSYSVLRFTFLNFYVERNVLLETPG